MIATLQTQKQTLRSDTEPIAAGLRGCRASVLEAVQWAPLPTLSSPRGQRAPPEPFSRARHHVTH